jgi:cytochrome c5
MYSNSKLFLVVFFVSVLFFSCSSVLYNPSPKNTKNIANLEELRTGRKIYVKKCSSCHTLVLPEKFNQEQWKTWVDKMEQRSKLKEGEGKLILKYLTKGL